MMLRKMTLLLLAVMFAGTASCILSDDIDDFDFKLPDKTFQVDVADLGVSTKTNIPCQPANDTCAQVDPAFYCDPQASVCALNETATFPRIACDQEDLCQHFGEAMYCDQGEQACRVEVDFELNAPVNLAEEVPELREVGNVTLTKVRINSLYITVEVNTLGVDTPEMGLYVGPQNAASVFDSNGQQNQGVIQVGTVPSFPPEAQRVDVVLTVEGRDALTDAVSNPAVPFKLFVFGVVEAGPGDPLPNIWDGQLKVVVSGEATASTAF